MKFTLIIIFIIFTLNNPFSNQEKNLDSVASLESCRIDSLNNSFVRSSIELSFSEDYQGALDYFGFEGTYDPVKAQGNPGATTRSGDIYYSETAFSSYDRLASVVHHEMFHQSNMLSGKYNNIDGPVPFDLAGLEEHGAYMLNYKNQGFYPKHGFPFLDRIQMYGSQGGLYDQYNMFQSKWWHFIYKIPRRY